MPDTKNKRHTLYPCENSITYIMHKEGMVGLKRFREKKIAEIRSIRKNVGSNIVEKYIEEAKPNNKQCDIDDNNYQNIAINNYFITPKQSLTLHNLDDGDNWYDDQDYDGDHRDYDNYDDSDYDEGEYDYFGSDYDEFSSDESDYE